MAHQMLKLFQQSNRLLQKAFIMKKIAVIALGCFLTVSSVRAGEPSAADQKWMTTVQKMVSEGKSQVSTPNKERVRLLKEWAGKNGYSVDVKQNDSGYRIELSKNLAQK